MAKLSLLCVSLCLVALFQGSLAIRGSRPEEYFRRQNVCQLDRLEALQPDSRIQAEAGLTETWNPNHDQFQCAGVALVRRTIEVNGLHLPSYTNTPQLIYVVRGRGTLGTVFPGCAETFEESQQGQSRGSQDRHQKVRLIREGDVIALKAGVAYWKYNNGDQPLVTVTLMDTSNFQNQLDQIPRRFYLAGNPEEEFKQQFQRLSGERDIPSRQGEGEEFSQNKRNILRGFNSRFLEEAFNVDAETVRKLQGQNDNRNNIVRVKGRLDMVSPMMRSGREYSQWEGERQEYGRDNGLEETFCSMRIVENIGDPSSADIFSPQAGRISTVNSFNLPLLRQIRLSAERGTLYNNGIYTPHWNMNAHSIMYVIKGRARVQVVDHMGRNFFDGEVRQGQILTVPQQHAVVKQATSEGFEWISFKTNDNAVINPLAGRTSAIRALPEAVLINAFQISREQAQKLKYNREETFLLASSSSSLDRREVA